MISCSLDPVQYQSRDMNKKVQLFNHMKSKFHGSFENPEVKSLSNMDVFVTAWTAPAAGSVLFRLSNSSTQMDFKGDQSKILVLESGQLLHVDKRRGVEFFHLRQAPGVPFIRKKIEILKQTLARLS